MHPPDAAIQPSASFLGPRVEDASHQHASENSSFFLLLVLVQPERSGQRKFVLIQLSANKIKQCHQFHLLAVLLDLVIVWGHM